MISLLLSPSAGYYAYPRLHGTPVQAAPLKALGINTMVEQLRVLERKGIFWVLP